MRSYNQIIFKGLIGKDARIGQAGGRKVANLTVATEYGTKKQDGTWDNETTWLNVVAWEGHGVCPLDQLLKGRRVAGSGRVRVRKFTTQQGEEREVTEVVVSDLDIVADTPRENAKKPSQTAPANQYDNSYTPEGDLPF